MAYVPKESMRKQVGASLRAVFDAPDRPEAERQLDLAVKKYRATAPKLAEWLESNVPQSLTAFALPASHRRRLRTTNILERVNREIKRRTRVGDDVPQRGLGPEGSSAAVLMEISEEWETGRKYVTMEPE